MMHSPSRPNLDELVSLPDRVADREIVLRGAFKEEIARLKELNKEFADRQGIVKTLKDADAVVEKAEEEASERRARALETEKAANLTASKSQAKLATVLAREEAVQKREREVADRENSVAAKEREALGAFDAERQRIVEREARLKDSESNLAKREKAVAGREARLRAAAAAVSEVAP